MKIAIDATSLPPKPAGAANYIIQLVHALARLPGEEELLIITHPVGKALLQISQPARQIETLVVAPRPPALRLVWEQVGLPRLLAQRQADLLHSPHYTRPLALPCRSLVTFHDMTFFLFPELHTRAKRIFFPSAIRLSARLADGLVAVSENTRQDAIRLLKIPPEKISTTHLGISPDFRPIREPALLEEVRQRYHLPQVFFLYVGTIEPRKGIPLLLRAYARWRSTAGTNEAAPLIIAGQIGWNSQDVFKMVETFGLKDQVQFTGYVPAAHLPALINLAEVFIYPSQYEGFGLPPLEALACGVPTITTAVSSMPEHIGQAGLLVPPGDEQALAQAIQRLHRDPLERARLATLGPSQAAHFTWERTAQATLCAYRRVMQLPQPRA